jgi:hypothetical protein
VGRAIFRRRWLIQYQPRRRYLPTASVVTGFSLDAQPAGALPSGSPSILGTVTTRHNLCPNPACGSNVTGWGGGSTPTQTTGLTGLPVTTGARYTANGYIQTPAAAASPGVTYTVSAYVANNSGFNSGTKTVYLTFVRSVGGDDFSQTTTTSLLNGAVTRVSHTGVAPANTTGVYLIIDTLNGTTGTGFDVTACLMEAATLGPYFDGNTPGASWDSTPDNSTSTFVAAGDILAPIPAGTAPSGSGVAFTTGTTLSVQPAATMPSGAGDMFTTGTVVAVTPAGSSPTGSPVGLDGTTILGVTPAGTGPSGSAVTFTAGSPGGLTAQPAATMPAGSPVGLIAGTVLTAQPAGTTPSGGTCTFTLGTPGATTLTVGPAGTLPGTSPVQFATGTVFAVAPGGAAPSGSRVTLTTGITLTAAPAGTLPSGAGITSIVGQALTVIPATTQPAGSPAVFGRTTILNPIPAITLPAGGQVTFTAREALIVTAAGTLPRGAPVVFTGSATSQRRPGILTPGSTRTSPAAGTLPYPRLTAGTLRGPAYGGLPTPTPPLGAAFTFASPVVVADLNIAGLATDGNVLIVDTDLTSSTIDGPVLVVTV